MNSKPNIVFKTPALAVLLLCVACVAVAQYDKPDPFAHYNLDNGLAAYNANTVVQDKRGFIWIGTINGLQRFDGHRFLTFRREPGNRNSLTDSYIDHLMYDSKGNLWVILGNGQVGTFDTRRFFYRQATLKVKDERILKLPRLLQEDSEGNVFYAIFGHEFLTYDPAKNEFAAANNKITVPTRWKITSLAEDRKANQFWISTDSGMCVFNARNKKLSYRGHNTEFPLIDYLNNAANLFNLGVDKRSRFWFTRTNAAGIQLLNGYDLVARKFIVENQDLYPDWIMKNYTVEKMMEQADGVIWIAGLNVMMKFNEKGKKFLPVYEEFSDEGITYQEINYLFEDRERNIWASTDNNGLHVLKPSSQQFVRVKQVNRTSGREDDGSIITIGTTSDNKLFAAAWNDGIHKYDSSLATLKSTPDERKPFTIWCMAPLADKKTMWMGLQSGLLIYDISTGSARYENPPSLKGHQIRTVAEDKLGNIWLGLPNGGVYKWVPEQAIFDFDRGFNRIDLLPSTQIEKITVDSKGYIWICTLMNGVYKLDPKDSRILLHLTSKGEPGKKLLADAVTEAFEYSDSTMIFLTGNLNFYNTKNDSVTFVTSADGLPSDIVRSIEKDNYGNLWLGLFNGLCRMNVAKHSFTYYDRNDGISNDQFNYSSSANLPDGRLAFGTTTDLIVFDPGKLNEQVIPPDITITDFMVLNKTLSIDSIETLDDVELNHDQNFISIGFSGLSYFNNKWSYYYKLDGIDKEWKMANDMSQVDYNYLPTGKYVFMVKAQNADGLSSRNITELTIKINPPIYKTWWFYSILILFVAFLLFIIDKERMRRKAAMQKMRADIADNLHEEVNTALNKINILSEMARLKAEKDPFRSTEYFEQIHTKSHDMIIAMDDMLWSIDPVNDSMEKTIDRIREFIDSLKRRHTANIDLLVDKKAEILTLNMRLRHDVFILMKEGIRTVIQAGSKNVRIHIGMQRDALLYTIDIDNDGCDLQQITNQLQQLDLEKRLNAIDAKLNSYIHQHTSIFELLVPVR